MGVVVTRPDGVVVACNPAAGQLLGRDPADLLGEVLFDAVHPEDLDDARRRSTRLVVGGTGILRHECRFRLNTGRVIWVSLSLSPVPEGGDRIEHVVVHLEDITERKRREAELSHQALHDPLTGLANRTLLIARIGEALSGRGRHARPAYLFYLDLNGFKGSTTDSGTPPGTPCSPSSPTGSWRSSGPATSQRAWAETSSRCCARTPNLTTPPPSPSGCARRPPSPF